MESDIERCFTELIEEETEETVNEKLFILKRKAFKKRKIITVH